MSGGIVLEAMRQVPSSGGRRFGDAVILTTDATFAQDVLEPAEPVLVEFTAPGAARARRSSRSSPTSSASTRAGSGSCSSTSRRTWRRPAATASLAPDGDGLLRRRGRRDDRRRAAAAALCRGGRPGARRVAVADGLLDGVEVVHRGVEAGQAGRAEPLPADLHPVVADALAARGVTGLYAHQAETWRRSPGRARRRHDGHGLREVARVLAPGARRDRARAGEPRALPLPHEGARAGPGALARLPRAPRAPAGDLRRRHADRAACPHPPERERDPHEPRHAPCRRPAAPRPLGERAPQPPGRRRRRGARVPRRVRVARGERPPAPPPLALAYGAEPVFVLASATIANAGELASRLTGLDVRSSTPTPAACRPRDRALEPGAPRRGARDAREPARGRLPAPRRPRLAGAEDDLLHEEPEGRRARPPLRERPARRGDGARLAPYRAGYTPEQRREIERRLVEGELLGVTATDALELGIDIGSLDCAISVGFPGTVASLRQQGARGARPGSRCSSRARTGSTSSS